jgi:transposase
VRPAEEEGACRGQPKHDLSWLAGAWANEKKKTTLAAEANPGERAAFQEKQQTLPIEGLVFIDEFASNIAMTRTRARAPIGERAAMIEPFNRGQNISTIGAMGLRGVCAPMMIEGAVNTEIFDLYVEHMLVPVLRGGDIVLLDNVKFHYSKRALSLIEAAGAAVLHIPAYSPDFNPIEHCIAKIKETLRSLKARTKRKLYNALAKAIERVTTDDIRGWFKHCGYVFSLN